jgi:hypothetical protein
MALRANDLNGLVKDIFEIDSYKSKLGDDEEIVVLSFTVNYEDAASDLENFLEMGYDFIIDCDVTSGEMDDGNYRVFVEIERGRHIVKQISEILDGVRLITGIERFKFRYYKSFRSYEATEEHLDLIVPKDGQSYKVATNENRLNNFSNFFSNSYADDVTVNENKISFKQKSKEPIEFEIIDAGPKYRIYEIIEGPLMFESTDIAETLFLTKYIGNYNITKISNKFIFENSGYAVALEKK